MRFRGSFRLGIPCLRAHNVPAWYNVLVNPNFVSSTECTLTTDLLVFSAWFWSGFMFFTRRWRDGHARRSRAGQALQEIGVCRKRGMTQMLQQYSTSRVTIFFSSWFRYCYIYHTQAVAGVRRLGKPCVLSFAGKEAFVTHVQHDDMYSVGLNLFF